MDQLRVTKDDENDHKENKIEDFLSPARSLIWDDYSSPPQFSGDSSSVHQKNPGNSSPSFNNEISENRRKDAKYASS